jgi:putative ABC transport system permease protein
MFMAVSERRAEIGLRRAIGARTRDIRLQFLSEAVAVTALGGVIAVAAAYAIVAVLALHGEASASMPWDAALIGLAAAVATGILAGTAPARRAAALDPVQTLR